MTFTHANKKQRSQNPTENNPVGQFNSSHSSINQQNKRLGILKSHHR